MKKFRFTLEAVHGAREIKMESEQLIFSELQTEVARAAERVREIERLKFTAMDAFAVRLATGEPLDPFELELSSNHIAGLDGLQCEARKVLEMQQQACRTQGEVLTAAAQEVKVTGRLRENQQSRYRLDANRREQNELDELVSANFARQISGAR